MYSGNTHFTVREAIQPKAQYRIQASTKITSGQTISEVYETRPFKECIVMTDISQVSGTNTTFNVTLQTGPDNVNFFDVTKLVQRTVAGKYYEKIISGYVSEYTRFVFDTVTSGGCWTQVDANFIR